MERGGWRVEGVEGGGGGGLRVEGGGWRRVEGGGWRRVEGGGRAGRVGERVESGKA